MSCCASRARVTGSGDFPAGRSATARARFTPSSATSARRPAAEIEILDLVGIYQLTNNGDGGPDLPDVLVHAFRGQVASGDIAVNSPGRICRLAWHDNEALPGPMTATARAAIVDALAGRSGVLRDVHRDAEPEIPDAVDSPADLVTAA